MSDFRQLRINLYGLALLCLAASGHADTTLSDPMRPPARALAGTPGAPAQPVLSYTRVSGNLRQALVDDRLVREGDIVAGARIERIERGKVHLRRGTTHQVLTLSARPRATPPTDPDKDSEHEQ